jgi:hypothetical protein
VLMVLIAEKEEQPLPLFPKPGRTGTPLLGRGKVYA